MLATLLHVKMFRRKLKRDSRAFNDAVASKGVTEARKKSCQILGDAKTKDDQELALESIVLGLDDDSFIEKLSQKCKNKSERGIDTSPGINEKTSVDRNTDQVGVNLICLDLL